VDNSGTTTGVRPTAAANPDGNTSCPSVAVVAFASASAAALAAMVVAVPP
jgi:hypothetical protein